ncbi:zinc finger protein 37 isoform X4 [Copidosoma floridanum]|uniref:zinc finger protein 37 isoform X4 n=1 Tax=Copidosoma floridanum TaxID=29053 RepID=UPI0006C9D777|nr:zinc finger protein 37 isoform X4 [Copidosoma floridanum]
MSSSLDYLELCRLCLVKENVELPIFEDDGEARQIYFKISSCLPVKVAHDDKLPKKICDQCGYKVELLYQFWNTTVNAEKQLLQWLGDVGELEDKQGYITEVLDSNVMKQERSGDSRLDGSVMQVAESSNIDINMIDNMSIITMPDGSEQQFTTVPIEGSSTVQTVQVVAGSSTQEQANVAEEEEEEDEDNFDDGCDNDDGMTVKEEAEDDQNERSLESTFVNVSLPCDEAGPSGLQQKIANVSEITSQTAEGDSKPGSIDPAKRSSDRGIFIFERETLVMRKWQLLEFDGKPYYAFVPEEDEPIKEEIIPELTEEGIIDDVDNNDDDDDDDDDDEHQQVPSDHSDEDRTEEPVPARSTRLSSSNVLLNGQTEKRRSTRVKKPEEKAPPTEPQFGKLFQIKMEGDQVRFEQVAKSSVEEEESAATEEGLEEGDLLVEPMDNDEDDGEEEVGSKSSSLKCKVCSESFDSPVAFKKHVALTHKRKLCVQENGTYNCTVCDYRTDKKAEFANHLRNQHETNTTSAAGGDGKRTTAQAGVVFPCAACGFVCRSKHSLQSHFIRKHTDRYEHQCHMCSKQFKVKGDLTNHVRFHHKEKPISCDVCGKMCMNTGSLYVHQKWAHFKPKFECQICHRRMVSQENLDQHMVMQHEKREKVVCQECGKTFTKKDSFKRHMSVHTGSKPYKCVICNKPFARRSQLRQHLLIHTGKRPFACDICGKAFAQKPGLICHRKTHPGNHPPLPVMPIGDLVKQFTEEYLASKGQKKSDETIAIKEALDDLDAEAEDDDEEEEEEDEEEEEEEIELEFVEEDMDEYEEIIETKVIE